MVCETVVWSLTDRVKNLIEKKWRGLSDNDMVTGGLNVHHPMAPSQPFKKQTKKKQKTLRWQETYYSGNSSLSVVFTCNDSHTIWLVIAITNHCS